MNKEMSTIDRVSVGLVRNRRWPLTKNLDTSSAAVAGVYLSFSNGPVE